MLIKKTGKDQFVSSGMVLFALNMLASVLNYVCQLIFARVLSVEAFGTINTIFSFLLIVGVPGTTLMMIVTRYYAESREKIHNNDFICKLLQRVSVVGVILAGILVLMHTVLSKVLKIEDNFVLLCMIILGILSLYVPLYTGVFSGKKKFVLVGFYSLLIPLYKIVSIIAAHFVSVNEEMKLYITLIIMILGNVLLIMYGHKKTEHILGKIELLKKNQTSLSMSSNEMNAFLLNICMMLYMNIDLFAIRYRGSSEESGLYSSVLLFGRIMYYFATTLGTILLPVTVSLKNDRKKVIHNMNKNILFTILVAVACLIPINLLGKQIILLLYGSKYIGAYQYIIYVSIISVTLGLSNLFINYFIGVGKTRFITVIMVLINVMIAMLVVFEKEVEKILMGIGIIGILGMLVIYGYMCSGGTEENE